MTSIDITPAGNQLYEVEVHDETGASRHQVGVPDTLLAKMDLDGVAVQDLVRAAMGYLLELQGREQLGTEVDLGAIVDRDPELVEQLPARARRLATSQEPPPDLRRVDPDAPTGDQRLVAEVEREQEAGQASRQDPHL